MSNDLDDDIYEFNARLKRRFRLSRWLITALFALLLGGGIMISSFKAEHGMIIYSDGLEVWAPSQSVALRLISFELFLNRPLEVTKATLTLSDARGEVVRRLQLSRALEELRQVTLTAPERSGDYQVRVEVEAIDRHSPHYGPDTPIYLVGERAVAVREAPKVEINTSKVAETPVVARARRGPGKLEIFAADQQLAMELPSTVFMVARDIEERPWRGDVEVKLIDGMSLVKLPRVIKTDERGVAEVVIAPRALRVSLLGEARIGVDHEGGVGVTSDMEQESSTEEYLEPQPYHFSLTPERRIVRSGEVIELEILSAQESPRLYLDLWWGARWLQTEVISLRSVPAQADRTELGAGVKYRGRARIKIPPLPNTSAETPQLLWVQAYEQPYQVDEVRGGAHLIWARGEDVERQVGSWLRARLTSLEAKPHGYWDLLTDEEITTPRSLRFALGRIARPSANMRPFINTAQAIKQSTAAMRDRYVGSYLRLIKSLALTMFAWLGILVVRQYRRQARQSEWSDPESRAQLRKITLRWLLYLTLVLSTFFGLLTFIPSLV